MRASKACTEGITWVWKKHFFLLWLTESCLCYEKVRSCPSFPLSLFFTLSLLASLSAVPNAGQVQKVHRPSPLQSESRVKEDDCCFFCHSAANTFSRQTSWPHSDRLPMNASHTTWQSLKMSKLILPSCKLSGYLYNCGCSHLGKHVLNMWQWAWTFFRIHICSQTSAKYWHVGWKSCSYLSVDSLQCG